MAETAWSGARLERDPAGAARLLRDGQVLAEFRAGMLDAAGFTALLDRLEAALRPAPPARAVIVYREGLLAEVRSETALDLLFVEEDPHDVPPVQLRRRQVPPDREGAATMAADAERRARQARSGN